jgi:hypothetical protein
VNAEASTVDRARRSRDGLVHAWALSARRGRKPAGARTARCSTSLNASACPWLSCDGGHNSNTRLCRDSSIWRSGARAAGRPRSARNLPQDGTRVAHGKALRDVRVGRRPASLQAPTSCQHFASSAESTDSRRANRCARSSGAFVESLRAGKPARRRRRGRARAPHRRQLARSRAALGLETELWVSALRVRSDVRVEAVASYDPEHDGAHSRGDASDARRQGSPDHRQFASTTGIAQFATDVAVISAPRMGSLPSRISCRELNREALREARAQSQCASR